MKSHLALLGLFALLISHPQLSNADCSASNFKTNSGEAKCRKDDRHDLINKESSKESGEAATPGSPPTPGSTPPTVGSSVSPASLATAATIVASSEEYDCLLVDALRNVSVLLSSSDQVILDEFIDMIQITILLDDTLSDDEKVVKCGYALKHFMEENYEIEQVMSFQQILGWGSFFDLTYVVVDVQIDYYESVFTLDKNGDCEVFEALLNATKNDTQKYSATLELIDEFRVVLEDVTWTQAQKMAKIHKLFKEFCDANPAWKDFFKGIEIPGFGSFESFDDVSHGYERALTISKVLVGSSDNDSPVLEALSGAVANTSFTITVRNQIKQFHDKLAVYFASVTDIDERMVYVSQQYWQLVIMEPWIVQYMSMISIVDLSGEEWGLFADLTWVSQMCNNTGSCGCMSCGLGGADCGSRVNLIAITAQNTTILMDVINANYNTWNTSTKLGFNSCKNSVIQAIWNMTAFPTPASKINEIVKDFKAYNANNQLKQQVLFNITLDVWDGQIVDFVNCGNM